MAIDSKVIRTVSSLAVFALIGIWLVADVLISPTSSLGRLYLYVTIAVAVYAIIRPRYGLYIVLPLTCYIDLFKRMMVIPGNPTEFDVAAIMAMPSAVICGSVVGVVMAAAFGRIKVGRAGTVAFLVALVMMGFSFYGGGSNSGMRGFGQALNQGVYALLFFLVPVVLDTQEKRRAYLQWTLAAFIPVAFYMIKHYFWGLANFEMDYLETYLSQEWRILYEDGGKSPRYFSTMNGAATVSTMLSIMILYCLVPISKEGGKVGPATRLVRGAVALLFAFAAALTISRTGWVCGMVAIGAYVLFGGWTRTMMFYAMGIGCFVLAVLSADYIITHRLLDDWQKFLADMALAIFDSPQMARAIVLGTMYDRLAGWSNLINHPEIFGLFGNHDLEKIKIGNSNLALGHDLVVIWLLKLGWIPMTLIAGLLGWFMFRLHKFQFGLNRHSLDFRLVRICLASATGMLAGGMANGAQLLNFPQNFYFYLWLSVALATYLSHLQQRREARKLLAGQEEARAFTGPRRGIRSPASQPVRAE